MALLSKRKGQPQQPVGQYLRTVEYKCSAAFRGTKRRRLEAYGTEQAQAGMIALRMRNPAHDIDRSEPEYICNLNGSTITINQYQHSQGNWYLQVLVNGNYIGTLFYQVGDPCIHQITMLISQKAELVHVKIESEHYVEKGILGVGVNKTRYVPWIFVK